MHAPPNFPSLPALKAHLNEKEKGAMTICNLPLAEYPGIFLNLGIIFNLPKGKYELDLMWIAYGLDLFGENLVENYLYAFESIDLLLAYLEEKYGLKVTDIPIKYMFDDATIPNPIKNEAEKPVFEEAWERFERDFATKKFLDSSLKLVYDTHGM